MKGFKWRVDSKQTGRYASFYTRSWPSLIHSETESLMAQVICETGYSPRRSKMNDLCLRVRIYSYKAGAVNLRVLVSKKTFSTLQEAKTFAERNISLEGLV